MATEPLIALTEIAQVIGYPEASDAVERAAHKLGIKVEQDWAYRFAVKASDARKLYDHFRRHPIVDPAEQAARYAAEGQMRVPSIRTKDGKTVPAVSRPGEPTAWSQDEW